jgi:hypothetical protein
MMVHARSVTTSNSCLKVEVKHPAQRFPAESDGSGQAGDMVVVLAVDIGVDGVFSLIRVLK